MKHYRNLDEVIHAYFNQRTEDGKSSSVYFYGNKLYSYGSHYVLAQRFDDFHVINDIGYSNSTAKHINIAKQAVHGQHFYLCNILPEILYNGIIDASKKIAKARKPEKYESIIASNLQNYKSTKDVFNDVIEVCGKYYHKEDPETGVKYSKLLDAMLEGYDPHIWTDKLNALREEKQRKEDERKRKARNDERKEFLTYKRSSIYNKLSTDKDILRISKDGQFVETSQGIRVSAESAKVLFLLIKEGRDIKGHNIDGYTVISINGVLTIGCHKIDMTYVNKIGNKLLTEKTI